MRTVTLTHWSAGVADVTSRRVFCCREAPQLRSLGASALRYHITRPRGPQGKPSGHPSRIQAPEVLRVNLNSFPQEPSCSKWPLPDLFVVEDANKRNPSTSTGSATGSASMVSKAAGVHPLPEKPRVYFFLILKGTMVDVCESAAIVEVREGPTVRELTVTGDCFSYEGRAFLNNLTRVLHKGSMINVDYMVGRKGGEDCVHCDVAWLGPKPKGVPCLSEDEFRQQLNGRGSSNTFINDLQRHLTVR
uniref:Uncharacterized protein n=1 Tax=Rhipicephalus zambeziensis TaxID=60191 RepID=A0A224YJ61_9ACAR